MRDSLETGINEFSEFNNFGFDVNIAKFVNYHSHTQDLSINVLSYQKNSNPIKLNPSLNRSIGQSSHRSFHSDSFYPDSFPTEPNWPLTDRKNYSMTCIDKCLTSVPHEIMQKQFLLTVLDLSRNKFEEFPSEVFLIRHLRILRIDYNRIKQVPSEIAKLTELEALSISYNLLQKLPATLGKLPQLRELNMEGNLIDNMSQEILGFKYLKSLNLLKNKLVNLPCAFRELTGLTEFYFEWFKYTNPPLDAHQRGSEGEHNLRKLKNKLNELYHKGAKAITFPEFLKLLSKNSVDFGRVNDENQNILHLACLNEDTSVIKFLIRNCPDLLEATDSNGLTPLCLSLLKDKGKSPRYLLKYGANAFLGNSKGSPIHFAAQRLNYAAIKDIIKLGENPNKLDSKGNTPLHYAMAQLEEGSSKAVHIVQYLLEKGADPNAKNIENWAPIHVAIRNGNYKTLDWMISYNMELQQVHGRDEIFNINKRGGGYKLTPMHNAASLGANDLVMILGDAGADMFKKSVDGLTPKMVVKQNGLTLKLIEKYEKEWLRKNIIAKEDRNMRQSQFFVVKNVNFNREIKNASKNKFAETPAWTAMQRDGTLKTKLEFSIPLRGSGMILQNNNFDNSNEISPETETNTGSSFEDTERGCELASEISENVRLETNRSEKNNGKSLQNLGKACQFLKEKNHQSVYQCLDIDIESRLSRLKSEGDLSVQGYAMEANLAQGFILSDRIIISDKIKILFSLQALYSQIVDNVTQKFYSRGNKEFLSWYIANESPKKGQHKGKAVHVDPNLSKILKYYEIIPQSLIELFIKLHIPSFENQLMKIYIVNILTSIKYFPAIEFLADTVKTSSEPLMIMREAQKSVNYLHSLLRFNPLTVEEVAQVERKIPLSRKASYLN